jgi:hypothetical protein
MPIIGFLLLMFLASLGQPGVNWAAPPAGDKLEELRYRVSLGIFDDVARVHLRLTQEGPNRYRADFAGAAQGVWKLLSSLLPESYETEMLLEKGRFNPLVYREVFQDKGHHVRKEYRFDYSQELLELWRSEDQQELVKEWQVPLQKVPVQKQIYDPLSFLYNLRLGTFGPLIGGETLRVAVVPTPETREIVLHIGQESAQGRKVMLEVAGKGVESALAGPYFLFASPQRVPLQAWTKVPILGKLGGELLNPEEVTKLELPALSSPSLRGQPPLPGAPLDFGR